MEKHEIAETVEKEMEQIRMWCRLLEENLVEMIMEWQSKTGYQSNHLKIYYSDENLKELLQLEQEFEKEELDKIISAFCMLESKKLGILEYTSTKKQYCIDVPEKGCKYVARRLAA